jgi:uncharacterized protein (TIGR00369 family)
MIGPFRGQPSFRAWIAKRLSPARRLEWFPPFRAMGIRVLELSESWDRARILLPLNAHTRNPGGSMFGGAIAALADPIAALACARRFPGYWVWTRDLQVDFLREGRTDLELRFEFDPELARRIELELARRGRCTPGFEYGLYLADGRMAAHVINHVALRPPGHVSKHRSVVPRRSHI